MTLFLAAVVAAAAAAAPAAPPVDPQALAAATVLVQQLDVRGQVNREAQQTIAAMRAGVVIRSSLAQQPGFIPVYRAHQAEFDAAFKKAGAIQANVADKVFRDNTDTVVKAAATAYARAFSAAELKQIGEFYKTPLGQAMSQKLPRVQAETSAANNQIIGEKLAVAMQSAAPQMRAALAPLQAIANQSSAPPPPAKK